MHFFDEPPPDILYALLSSVFLFFIGREMHDLLTAVKHMDLLPGAEADHSPLLLSEPESPENGDLLAQPPPILSRSETLDYDILTDAAQVYTPISRTRRHSFADLVSLQSDYEVLESPSSTEHTASTPTVGGERPIPRPDLPDPIHGQHQACFARYCVMVHPARSDLSLIVPRPGYTLSTIYRAPSPFDPLADQ